ncbi:hypothetical protein A6U97_28025 [Agrobacterium tumefaciens]|uniref:hypothetical protein n=1 Tax=Agrobacterium tumefaciens TaxID=358 RepID=UPI00080FC0A0|nr:hypothetical protein A6U97_28025 [Agrobacterium tumefaciens]
MSNILYPQSPRPVLDDPSDELAQFIQDTGLSDIMAELDAKLVVMLGYLTEFRNIANAEIERKGFS